MHPLYNEFLSYLDNKDKEKCVQFAVSNLTNGVLDVVTLYEEILTPALYSKFGGPDQKDIIIWEEHVRTSIVRTIIECCYPYVIKERDEKYKSRPKDKVVVLCPPEELHEIGARMVADFFTLCGYNITFVGANTPRDDIVNAIKYFQPEYIAISITNAFNLVTARKVVKRIVELEDSLKFKVILGGQACKNNPETCREMGVDLILNSFEDIRGLSEGEPDAGV
jgi:methanogenic corrinoid protein MtbC1